jgi:hypothetical protein
MNGELNKWKKKELQDFLKECQQPTFGNKPELIERVIGAKALGLDKTNTRKVLQNAITSVLTPLGENLPTPSPFTMLLKWCQVRQFYCGFGC